MKAKTILIKLFLCFFLCLQTSCVTKYIWGDKSYDEEIEQFFVGSDGRSIALIGSSYHYVFSDNSGMLKNVLSLKQKGILQISDKTHLKLDSNNNITGAFILEGPASILPREDLRVLKALGFEPNRKDVITIKIHLVGRRYAPRFLGQNVTNKLSDLYGIKIYYSDSNLAKDVGKAAITPIAVTLDAAILVGKVVFYPFSL